MRYLSSEFNIKKLANTYNKETFDDTLNVKESYFWVLEPLGHMLVPPSYNLMKNLKNVNEKNGIMIEKRVHKLRAKVFYSLLREKKESLLTISFDCQKIRYYPSYLN